MKRKLLCIILTLIMMMQCFTSVYAQSYTDSVVPGVDMEVKKSTSSSFLNGPLRIKAESVNADFRATLEMKSVFEKFIEWYGKAENIINNMTKLDSSLNKELLMNQLNNLEIIGEFIVTIKYPKEADVPDAFITGGDMYGFNEGAKNAFYEKSRVIDKHSDADENIITVTIGVCHKDPSVKLLAGVLYENREEYLADITLTAEKVKLSGYGTYTAKGTLTGYTEIKGKVGSKDAELRVDYEGKQIEGEGKENKEDKNSISATVELYKSGPSGPSSSGGGSTSVPKLIFNIDGDTDIIQPMVKPGTVTPENLPKPEKPGYEFSGWHYDSGYKNPVNEPVTVIKDTILYGHWKSLTLESEDHFAYIIGYPDGTVRPSANISREEVATIFYRLLREDKLISIASDENNFSDVEKSRWSNKAISSLANGKYINGYEDGTFRPENHITRAEFAAMATRYAELTDNGKTAFTDIAGHWAETSIKFAASAGWVNGYEDGSFKPESYITRAEVMAIINRMLVRCVDESGLHADTKYWIDMNGDEWYYYEVLEATNAHDYTRKADGRTESWTAITVNKIWVELDEMENAD